MKKILIGLTIAAVLVLTVATVAFAADDTPLFPGRGQGGSGGPGNGTGVLHDYIVSAMADALGISVDELNARLEDGERMYDIATSLGMSQEAFFQAMSEARAAAMEQAYTDGLVTQEQYEFWLNNGGMGRMGGGQGGRGGHVGQGGAGGQGGMGGGGFGGVCPFASP